MFDGSSVYVLSTENKIYRLELDRDLQASICATFASSVESLVGGKKGQVFTANYKPEDDEFLKIENFQLPDEIRDAIRNPLGISLYEKDPDIRDNGEEDFTAYPDIKALFVGERIQEKETEKFNIAFQRYRREQNIVALPFRLYFSNRTFKLDKRFGIGIPLQNKRKASRIQGAEFSVGREVGVMQPYSSCHIPDAKSTRSDI